MVFTEWLTLTLLATLLAGATWLDWRHNRIPNALSFGGAGAALLAALLLGGASGLLLAVAGLAVGLLLFLPAYAMGVMGGGDVKLMAMVGAFLGPVETVAAIVFTLLAGGAYGLLYVFRRDTVSETLRRYVFGMEHWILGGGWLSVGPKRRGGKPLRFPFALAITTGTVASLTRSVVIGL